MKTPKGERFERSATVDRAKIDEKARTVEIAFSSEAPVSRWFGVEVLSHAPGAMKLDRLNGGGAVLWNHDRDVQIGVVERATCDPDKKGRAVIRFGASAKAEEIWKDVQSGVIRNVSVGYSFDEMTLVSETDGVKTYRIDSWEPVEVSLVSIPADTTVGVGRAEDTNDKPASAPANPAGEPDPMKIRMNLAPDGAAGGASTVDVVAEQRKATDIERNRIREINAIGEAHGMRDLAQSFVNDGKGVDEFRSAVLAKLGAKPAPSADIGLTKKEVKRYSIVKALREMAVGGVASLTGLEKEAHFGAVEHYGRKAEGFLIPHDVFAGERALNATVPADGGYLVGTDTLVGSMIELLRNKLVVGTMGATMLDGLTGNVAIPKVTGGATAYWLSETGEVSASTQQFGQLGLTPHRLGAATAYTKQLVAQTSLSVESFVRNDIARVLATALDLAALHGTGNAGQPLGIFGTANVGSVTFGAAATWAKILAFESTLDAANAEAGNIGWITTGSTRAKWKAAVKFSNTASPLWADDNTVNGYPAKVTNQISTNKVVFGNWSDLIMASWAGTDVVVDPYTLAATGQIKIVVQQMADIGVRHPASFVISSDSGAQ